MAQFKSTGRGIILKGCWEFPNANWLPPTQAGGGLEQHRVPHAIYLAQDSISATSVRGVYASKDMMATIYGAGQDHTPQAARAASLAQPVAERIAP